MGAMQTQRWCKLCGRKTLHARRTFGLGWGLFLTLITAGLFIPVWLLIKVYEAIAVAWRCQACGQS
jgi:hypothetical protein